MKIEVQPLNRKEKMDEETKKAKENPSKKLKGDFLNKNSKDMKVVIFNSMAFYPGFQHKTSIMPHFLYNSLIIVKRFEGDDQIPIPSITFKKNLGKSFGNFTSQ